MWERLLAERKRLADEEAQRKLARMIAVQEAFQAKLTELRAAHGQTVEGRRMAPNQVVDLAFLQATDRFLLVLEQRIIQTAQELTAAQGRVAEARQELLRAHQDHLMLVRLKERRLEQHVQESNRSEAREQDEIAVLRHRINRPATT